MAPKLLALDLEGTLISNAVSQFPRPGLHRFLTFCRSHFTVVVYTAVSEPRARAVLRQLESEGSVPTGFSAVPYVPWSGPHKDLRFALPLVAGSVLDEARLVDDLEAYVHPGQTHLWVPIPSWSSPYPPSDQELSLLQIRLIDPLES